MQRSSGATRVKVMIAVVSVMLLFTFPVFAQGAEPGAEEIPSLVDTLGALAQAVGVGAVVAFLFERFAWFQAMSSDERWWVVAALSILLPLGARLLLDLVPADIWAQVEPYWQSIAAGFVLWTSSQIAHRVDPAAKVDAG